MSPTIRAPGASGLSGVLAAKSRPIRSGAGGAFLSCLVRQTLRR